jgi:Meiosis protein SPO22/ZIP4 like
MFSKALFSDKTLEPRIAEDITDTLYEIGNDLLKKRQYELSVRWLERAYGILAGQDLENLSKSAGELRCSVLSCLGLVESFSLRAYYMCLL